MSSLTHRGRTDSASIVIRATPRSIYRAFTDSDAWVQWLPPSGMTGRIDAFDLREGGAYRMTLVYLEADRSAPGKTSDDTDVVQGTFVKLVPDERVVQRIEFESDDPAYAGVMTMTWLLEEVPEGTKASIVCENVPEGIRQEDHDAGLRSTLSNLAVFVEKR